ncbi:hypothetical protein ACFODZ_07715 [Marinicella sediminis]|uniref:Alpha/beta hydrolase n=1 Tax=Marinicella sediminis TaxID=1792834 RepID=A0ABV7J876_9GAMM|nr:hypothetical protein [Marinicella sediminis]
MRWLGFIALVWLSACQVSKKPDLAKLYQPHGTDHSNTPLVLIHGTMGSKLRHKVTGDELWPGKINQLIFSNYRQLANVIDPQHIKVMDHDIESYAIFDSYSGLSVYDEIIKTLTTYGGYQENTVAGQALPGRNLYVFHYDWRQDNVVNAGHLASFIEQVLAQHPEHQQLDVVAHSMGGLILRYYQRFGGLDVLPAIEQSVNSGLTEAAFTQHPQDHLIRHAIFLGTPQLGSVKSVARLQHGFDFNLRNVPVEVQVTMPSVYQLLPHPDSSWAVDEQGKALNLDVFDPHLWQQNQWSVYDPKVQERIIKDAETEESGQLQLRTLQRFFAAQLSRARAFWLSLSPQYDIDHEGYVIMGGDCDRTLNRLIVQDVEGRNIILDDIRMSDAYPTRASQKEWLYAPGDGQVSKASLLGQIHDPVTHQTLHTLRIRYPVFVCENHIKLTQNITFQDNLLHILLNE